jgi:hypothetical protein
MMNWAIWSGGRTLPQVACPSRRLTSRSAVSGEVWIYWRCNGREDVSRVRNIGLGGLFIETQEPRAASISVRLDFLVQEGQIRADAVVRHAKPGVGLGLKFAALSEQDRPRLAALLTRLRGPHQSRGMDRSTPWRNSSLRGSSPDKYAT